MTAPVLAQEAAADDGAAEQEGTPFSFDWLTERMREAATKEPAAPETIGGFLSGLDYDDFRKISYAPDHARWSTLDGVHFQLHAFHTGWLYKEPVGIHQVVDGQALPFHFTREDFNYRDLAEELPEGFQLPGIAGFKLTTQLNSAALYDELVAFLGASYFRALGRDNTYGLSARGLAVNTGSGDGEEFPRFSEFWLEQPQPGSDTVVLYAALESDSVTGAYRFVITPGEVTVIDVTARLFLRADVEQLGIAPLTSMFLYGDINTHKFDDFRPAVHDSEAMVVNTRAGKTFYRPLSNPPRLASSYFGVESPVSFGLVQRNRDFEEYLDAEAHYELRPTLMVEPLGEWGAGNVRLMEIPSKLEGNDNIVAFWIPEGGTTAGDEMEFAYRLHWGMTAPGDGSSDLARVLRTRAGKGGVAGVENTPDRRKFVIDFEGGILRELPDGEQVSPSVSATNGDIEETVLSRIEGTDIWRLVVEVKAPAGSVVEMSANLSGYGRELSETWVYQWVRE
ncbi:glucan biosynthesis protein [Allosediminivita pacifica]|uniref:Glucans biosynthesis protein n=1 Tax=Allosediminivita pacifica TaxID=1267769 RepID=A0A2T6APW8_9RHOB|nr:glucan biosynthesis protein G [Allosediminivita pacifica]PTX45869.1 glucans biosynthesis protein [Allosediminivita pacifica]